MNKRFSFTFLFVVAFFAALWLFFFLVYPYHLHFKEQLTLFMADGSLWQTYLSKPAFLTQLAGDYLTQYFLLSGGGPTVLVLGLLLLWMGLQLAFQRLGVRHAALYALWPVALEAALSLFLEYPLSMPLGTCFCVWAFFALSYVPRSWQWLVFGVVALGLYPLAGVPFLSFVLLASVFLVKKQRLRLVPLMIFIAALITPLLYGFLCFGLTPRQAYFYPIVDGYMLHFHFIYLVTDAALLLALLCGGALVQRRRPNGAATGGPAWVPALAALVLAVGVGACCYDDHEEQMLGVATEAYYQRWDKVERLSAENPYRGYIVAYYANLAMSHAKQLPYTLLERYQPAWHGLLLEINEHVGYLPIMFSTDAFMECGDMAQAQHAALLGFTFTPHQRSSRMARKLAEIAMINEDYDAAVRYLEMLRRTRFHKQWAETCLALCRDKSAHQLSVVFTARPLRSETDLLFSPNHWFAALRNLLEANPNNQIAADYLLCLHLLNKDLAQFKKDFDLYYHPVFGDTPPPLYQQALVMCVDKEADPVAQLTAYHISAQVVQDCTDFLDMYHKAGGNGTSLQARFGTSYWFYFYYAQIKE